MVDGGGASRLAGHFVTPIPTRVGVEQRKNRVELE
mgnify:CR=1 FL=1